MSVEEPIKVIHVIPSSRGGGAEFLVERLLEKLPDYGIEAHAIYFIDAFGLTVESELKDKMRSLGLSSHRTPLAIFKLRRELTKMVGKNTIIHAHLTWPLYYVPLSILLKDIPCVYTEHSSFNRRRNLILNRDIDLLVYRRYKKIICISEGVQQRLNQWLRAHLDTEVIYNGARIYDFFDRTGRDRERLRLVSVGSLHAHKGLDVAIRAVAIAKDVIEKYRIVGSGPMMESLRGLANTLGLQGVVEFLGWQDNIEPHLRWADVQLMPSKWEGFGLVAVEGMSTGLPVLASDVDGLREVIGGSDGHSLLVKGDADAWAGAVRRIHGLSCYEQISQDVRKNAERFSIDSMVENYANLYKKII